MGKKWKEWETIFLGSNITAAGDCSHEIKRCLLLGRKAMTNLDSILKSRDVTLPTKVHLVKALVFPVVMYGCESWTIKKAERWRIDAFELWCWRRLLRVPCTARRSNQSILKEISPEYSLEGLTLKLKFQYFGHVMWRADSFEKTLMLGKNEGEGERGDRGWDGWMAWLTQWTWVWASLRRWWWTGKAGLLQSTGSQRVRHDWVTELTKRILTFFSSLIFPQSNNQPPTPIQENGRLYAFLPQENFVPGYHFGSLQRTMPPVFLFLP